VSVTRALIALAVLSTLVGGAHYYLWARLARDPAWPGPWRRVLTLALVALALSIPAAVVAARTLPRDGVSPFAWVAFTWMGLVFFLLVLTLTLDLLRGVALLAGGEAARDPERRRFLSRALAAVAGLGAGGLGAFAFLAATRPVGVKKVTVPLRNLPAALDGFTIVQLTDIHVGPTIGRGFIEELVARVNGERPDLIAITGDLVDGSVEELGAFLGPFTGFESRHGTYFVTGNHEYYSGHEPWIRFLETLGVRVLRNERVRLAHPAADGGPAAALELAGVNDYTAGGFGDPPDLARAVAGRDPNAPLVLLAHQPRHAPEAAEHGVSLQLSGHTHGGQIFPFNFLVHLQQPFVAGLHALGEMAVYVSRGTGYWGPPMRLGAPAEITRIELRPAAPGEEGQGSAQARRPA